MDAISNGQVRDIGERRPLRLSTFRSLIKMIGAAIKIHRRLGPGLLESAYEACLAYELRNQGLQVIQQKGVPLIYGEP